MHSDAPLNLTIPVDLHVLARCRRAPTVSWSSIDALNDVF